MRGLTTEGAERVPGGSVEAAELFSQHMTPTLGLRVIRERDCLWKGHLVATSYEVINILMQVLACLAGPNPL